ncbi:hypothetical protein [Prochlorothrix hollandica]|uniref:hypothetical protein n=1 Tax=Prochlorothrix hollandica TaxID=1223 RepID=UPI0033414C0E
MKSSALLRTIALTFSVAISLACREGIANDDHTQHSSNGLNTMNTSNNQGIAELVTVMISQVIAREEVRPPVGVPLQPNRDIGFASIFLDLLNNQEKDHVVTIEAVEIYNVTSKQLESFEFLPQEVILRPLENSIISISLTNKVGYGEGDSAKATVTYTLEGKTYKIESAIVPIDYQ